MEGLEKNRWLYNITLCIFFVILSLLFVYPLAKTNTIFFSDDMYYHIQRINELISNYQSKNYFVGIYTSTFNQMGYPLNLFYPWVTLIPFVLFSFFIQNKVQLIYLGISFYTFLTLVFTYWTTLKFSKNRLHSLVTAIIYAFCSYRVIDIFARFALGEFLTLTFLPLCVYGLFALVKGNYNDWPFLAFGISFVLLSHILSTFIYLLCLTLLFLILILSPVKNIKSRLLALVKSVVVAVTSSAIFLFPFLEQEIYQKFNQPSKMNMVAQALFPSKLFAASLNNNLGRIDAGNTYNIGFVLLLVLILGLLKFRSFDKSYKAIFLLAVGGLLFTTILLPWSELQKTPLSLIQFPWRFLGPVSYLLSIVGGYEALLIKKNNLFVTCALVILILIPWYSGISNLKNELNNPNQFVNYHSITYQKNKFIYMNGIKDRIISLYYLDQYTPKKGLKNLDDVIKHRGSIDDEKHIFINKEKLPNKIEYVSNKFRNSRNIILPIYMYKNIEVVNGNGKKLEININKADQIKIQSTFGSSIIKIIYKLSKLDILSVILSLGTWFIGTIVLIKKALSRMAVKCKGYNAL